MSQELSRFRTLLPNPAHSPNLLWVLRKRRGFAGGNSLDYVLTVARMSHHSAFCTDFSASGLVEAKTVCHRQGGW